MGYQDVVSIPDLLRPPTIDDGGINDLIDDQGLAVQAVNALFEAITGESLTEMVIVPITGDWPRIAANADAWRNTASAVEAVSDNLTANVDTLQDHWDGAASDAFGNHVRVVWFAGLYAHAGIASLISEGFDVVATESQRLCGEVLELLNRVIEKVASAISTGWIPFVGWGRAIRLVWDAYNIYQSIRALIDALRGIIEAAKALFDALGEIRSALEAIPDVRNANDAAAVIGQLAGGAGDALDAAEEINDAVTGADSDFDDATDDATDDGREAGGGSSSW